MYKSALLFATVLFSAAGAAFAYDDDPGYGPDSPWRREGNNVFHRENGRWFGGGGESAWDALDARRMTPRYFRPTQRYYGNGYTVSYRYIPVYPNDPPRSGAVGDSTNFPTDGFHLTPAQVDSFGTNPPRVTKVDPHSGAPRTAVTSITRKKKTTTKTTTADGPAIVPAPVSAPAVPDAAASPVPATAPAPDAGATPVQPKP